MNLGTLVATLTVETAGLKKAIVDFGKLQKSIVASSNKMVRQLGTISAAVKRLDRNIAMLSSGSSMSTFEKKMLAATNKMVRSLGRLTNQTRILKKEMQALAGASVVAGKAARKAAAEAAAVTGGATAIVGGGTTSTSTSKKGIGESAAKTAKAASASLGTLGNTLTTMSLRLRSFGWLATTVFTAPLLMGGAAVTKMGRDFEMAMAKIQGLVGIAKRQVDEWNISLLRMAKSVAVGPMELADTLYYVASSGFKTKEALIITEMAAKGAATGLGETKDVANFLTSAMNAYRSSGLSAARAMDILTAAVREGKGEPAEMSRALGTILPIAAELGVSLDQVAGALASMTLITSQTSNAATYLRNVLMKLMHPSAGTEKALKAMGTSVQELNNMLKSQGLMPTLMRLRELTDEYGTSMSKVFPNIRALLGALNLTGQNMKYNESVMKAVTESMGDFEKAFFIASGTVAFRWNAAVAGMKASFIELGVAMAQAVLPILEKWIGRIQVVIKWFNGLDKGVQKAIVKFLAFLAVLGPAVLVISTFGMAIGTIMTKIDALGGAVLLLSKLLMASPWIALAVGIGAATIAIVRHIKAKNELANIEERINTVISGEAYKMQYLFQAAMKAAEGTKARKDAINAINEKYGIYIGYVIKDTAKTNDLSEALKNATKNLEAYIATKEMQLEVDKQHEKAGAGFTKYLGDYVKEVTRILGPEIASQWKEELDYTIEEALAAGTKVDAAGKMIGPQMISDFFWKWQDDILSSPLATGKAFEKMFNTAAFSMAVGQFERIRNQTDPIIKELTTLMGVYSGLYKNVQRTADSMNSLYEAIKDEDIKEWLYSMDAAERALNAVDEALVGSGQESKIAEEKLGLYNSILEKLATSTAPEAAEWIEYVQSKIKHLGIAFDDSGADIETLGEIMADFQNKLKALEEMKTLGATVKSIGKTFDYTGEKVKLYEETLKRLVEKHYGATLDAQVMRDALANMEANTFTVVQALDMLDQKMKVINQRKLLEGVKFDFNASSISAFQEALTTILESRAAMENLDKTFVTIEIPEAPFKKVIPLADMLNSLITDIYKNLGNLEAAQQQAIDTETIALLKAEAEKFGGVAGKVEVLNYQLQATERYLRALLRKQYMNEVIPEEDIQKAVDQINILKQAIDSLNQALDLRYLEDMARVMNDLDSYTALWNGQMDIMRSTLSAMSTDSKGATEEFANLAKQLRQYEGITRGMEYMNNVIDTTINTLIEGGDETESVWKKLGESLERVMKQIIADLITTIAKTLILKAVMKNVKFGETDIGKQIIKSLQEGISGIPVFDIGEMFDASGVDKMTKAIDDLNKSMVKYNEIVGSLLSAEIAKGNVVKTGTEAIGASDDFTKAWAASTDKQRESLTALTQAESAEAAMIKVSTATEQSILPMKQAIAAADTAQAAAIQTKTAEEAASIPITAAATAQDAASIPVKTSSAGAAIAEGIGEAAASGAKMPFPVNLIAIAAGIAAVMAAVSLIARATKMKKGGEVPPGFPDDTFPALLTSGEVVVPKEKVTRYFKKKDPTESFVDTVTSYVEPVKLQTGGVIPEGYPNDTYLAMLSSGEMILPKTFKFPNVFKIIDERTKDAITGNPVSSYSKIHGDLDFDFVEEVVRKALERSIDPYTALAIPLQEKGKLASQYADPYNTVGVEQKQLLAIYADEIGGSLDVLRDKLKMAERLNLDTYAKQVQTFNGLGTLRQSSFGTSKAYGVNIPEEGISMKKNPLYGKRIEDIRNNILMQNEELVSYVESIAKNYPQPTLPKMRIPEQPHGMESTIPVDTSQSLTAATVALDKYLQTFGIFNERLDILTEETNIASAKIATASFIPPITDNPFGGYNPKPLSLGSTTIEGGKEFNAEGIEESTNALQKYYAAMSDSDKAKAGLQGVGTLFTTLAGATEGSAAGWLSFVGTLTSTIPQIITGLGALTIAHKAKQTAATGDAVAEAAAGSMAMGPIIGLITLAASVAAIFAALASVPKAAKGGIVPPGFANDTYPAFLTSGEMVVPKTKVGRIPTERYERADVLEGDVRFVIEQDKLVGILKKADKKNKIY